MAHSILSLIMKQENLVHIVAVTACLTSIVGSVFIIIHSSIKKNCENLFRKGTLIDRFQIYLAIEDLLFGVWHCIDHTYVLVTQKSLNEDVCSFIGFMVFWAFNSMGFISCIVTFSAFLVVILEKKLRFWKFDLFLWIVGMGLPFLMMVVAICRNWIGFNGYWCGIKTGIVGFSHINIIYTGSIHWVNILLSIFTYSSIFVKIIRSSIRVQKMKRAKINSRIMTTDSKRMTMKFVIFVLILLIQWMPLSIYLIYSAIRLNISNVLLLSTVIFSNLGGLFNTIIYLAFRKTRVRPSSGVEKTQNVSTLQTRSESLKT